MRPVPNTDHRKFPRRRFATKVTIRDCIRGRRLSGAAVDVNPLGMLLEVRKAFKLGEIISLSFPSPEGDHTVRVSGEVVRISDASAGRYQVGVEFFDVDNWLFEELCAYVYEAPQKRELMLVVDNRR